MYFLCGLYLFNAKEIEGKKSKILNLNLCANLMSIYKSFKIIVSVTILITLIFGRKRVDVVITSIAIIS